MLTVDELSGYSILFVDDEEKARKYFKRAFSEKFHIITAESVDKAISVLTESSSSIGLLVTDQRMPGKQGTDLLKHTRQNYPNIVRMLTTAYTELDDAIEAVNRGEIYRYITKPWDIQSLETELVSGLRFYHVSRERNLLLKEKLSVWQRMRLTSFVRDLIVMSGGLTQADNSLAAISAFLNHYASHLLAASQVSGSAVTQGGDDPWLTMQNDIKRSLEIEQNINNRLAEFEKKDSDGSTVLVDDLKRLVDEIGGRVKFASHDLQDAERQNKTSLELDLTVLQSLKDYLLLLLEHNPCISISLTEQWSDSQSASKLVLKIEHFEQLVSYENNEHMARLLVFYYVLYNKGLMINISERDTAKLTIEIECLGEVAVALADDWIDTIFVNFENLGQSVSG